MKQRAVIGIDVGGSHVSVGIVLEEGRVLYSLQYPQEYCDSSLWSENLAEHIEEVLGQKPEDVMIEAFGIGFRGHVDFKRQLLTKSSILNVEKGFDICGFLKERFRIPAYIDNDVKAAACGELLFGAGKKYQNFICYNVGTGIAAALILDGKLVRGWENNAGEIGDDLFAGTEPGKAGKGLEAMASGKGIEDEAALHRKDFPDSVLFKSKERVTAKEIVKACRQGDPLGVFVIRQAVEALAVSIVNMGHLVDPEAFLFTGGVVSETWFFDQLKEKVGQLQDILGEKQIRKLERSEFASKCSGPLGAAAVGFYGTE